MLPPPPAVAPSPDAINSTNHLSRMFKAAFIISVLFYAAFTAVVDRQGLAVGLTYFTTVMTLL